jgi:flagellar biosynthesis protein FlhG
LRLVADGCNEGVKEKDEMAQSIAITSGKGGVGKTSIAVNLALVLRQMGSRVTLLDADFGMANAHILMGANLSPRIDKALMAHGSVEGALTNTAYGVKLLSGGSTALELLDLEKNDRLQLIRNVEVIGDETDYLIVDTPAGASDATLAFVAAADRVLLVLVGEPTSFIDAYTILKAAHLERGVCSFVIVVNMARDGQEARRHFEQFQTIALRFLDVDLTFAGHLPISVPLRLSVVARRPLMANPSEAHGPEGQAFRTLAQKLLNAQANAPSGIRFFIENAEKEV